MLHIVTYFMLHIVIKDMSLIFLEHCSQIHLKENLFDSK